MIRYDYLSQEYQRECEERAREHDAILAWQRDKKLFEENYKTMQIAMVRYTTTRPASCH